MPCVDPSNWPGQEHSSGGRGQLAPPALPWCFAEQRCRPLSSRRPRPLARLALGPPPGEAAGLPGSIFVVFHEGHLREPGAIYGGDLRQNTGPMD